MLLTNVVHLFHVLPPRHVHRHQQHVQRQLVFVRQAPRLVVRQLLHVLLRHAPAVQRLSALADIHQPYVVLHQHHANPLPLVRRVRTVAVALAHHVLRDIVEVRTQVVHPAQAEVIVAEVIAVVAVLPAEVRSVPVAAVRAVARQDAKS